MSEDLTALRLEREMNEAFNDMVEAKMSYNYKKQKYVNYCTQPQQEPNHAE